eukprot:4246-Chlamydomonas_euryale.AAC.2
MQTAAAMQQQGGQPTGSIDRADICSRPQLQAWMLTAGGNANCSCGCQLWECQTLNPSSTGTSLLARMRMRVAWAAVARTHEDRVAWATAARILGQDCA